LASDALSFLPGVPGAGADVARVERRLAGRILPLRYLWPRVDASQGRSALACEVGDDAYDEALVALTLQNVPGDPARFRIPLVATLATQDPGIEQQQDQRPRAHLHPTVRPKKNNPSNLGVRDRRQRFRQVG
jgi:hypothetical protein